MSYIKLFFTFLKTGTISFGGYMMLIAMIQHEFSVRKKILSKKKILDAITMASFLPGPMAINVASYIGFLIRGWKGAVISFIGVLLPSFIIMVIFSHLYLNSRNIPGFSSFFDGVMPVVAAVIFSVGFGFYKDSKDKIFSLLLVILSFTLTSLIKGYISIILPLLICGGLNLLYNGDKIKKITNPKKAFIRIKGIVIASLIMILLFVFLNNAPINSDPDTTSNVKLMEIHAKYVANDIYAVFEYGNINYDGTNHTPNYKSSGGYYLDLGYNIASMLNLKGKLMPWFRYSDYNRGTNDDGVLPSKHYTISRFGLTFWPVNEVAFKIDFGTKTTEDADVDDITQLNIGVGYNF